MKNNNGKVSMVLATALVFTASSISVFAENNVAVDIKSDRIGNIFYNNEPAEFDICFENLASDSENLNITYKVYDIGATQYIDEDSIDISLNVGSRYENTIKTNVPRFGQYRLEVYSGGEKIAEKDFSNSVMSENTNSTLGVSAHLTTAGNIEDTLQLMKNAGIGIIRDDFRWNDYEIYGEMKLPLKGRQLITRANDYGIEILPILYANHRIHSEDKTLGESNDTDYLNAFGTYVTSIMETEEFQKYINNVEIANEPDCASVGNYNATDASAAAINARAESYAKVLEIAYDAVKNVKPSVKVGGFTTCSINSERSLDFIDAVLNKMNAKKYDAITAHPYFGKKYTDVNTGIVTNNSLTEKLGTWESHFTDKFNSTNERWYTEFGSTNAGEDDGTGFYSKDEYVQAYKNIRAYNSIKKYNMNDKLYLYSALNSGEDQAVASNGYGMLKAWNDKDPYAAKLTYLAVANLNNLVGNATGVEAIAANSKAVITKYTCPDRTVYIMNSAATTGDANIPAEPIDAAADKVSGAVYYDMLGNKIEETAALQLTDAPVYAVVGTQPSYTLNERGVNIEGNIASGKEGKMVSLTIVEESVGFDGITGENILYMNQQTTETDGKFRFKVDLGSKSYAAYIVSEDAELPLKFTISNTANTIKIRLYDGMIDMTTADVALLDLSNLSADITFKNLTNAVNYKLFCALYNNNSLVNVDMYEDKTEKTNDTQSVDVSTKYTGSYDLLKLMMWDKNNELFPLCDVVVVD